MRRILAFFAVLLVSSVAVSATHATWTYVTDRDWDEHHGVRNDTIWVTNRDQGTFMVFNAATGRRVTREPIPVGTGAHDLVVSETAGKTFVMNELEDSVAVVSASTLERLDTIPLGPRPHHTKLSWNGRTIYVGLFGTNLIAAIDARTQTVRQYVSADATGVQAHAPRPSHNGRFVYVPHEIGNLVTELRARTGEILRSVAPGDTSGGQPSEVLPTRDGETLYVSMRNEGKIKKINLESFTMTGEAVDVGTQPESLILTPDERTLIVTLRGTPAQVAFVNTKSFTLERTVAIGGAGTFGDLAVASPDGRYVFATFDAGQTGQGGVARIDLYRRTIVTWPYPGMGRPHGIAYSTISPRTQ
jgi:DNA-binding beta-propeller fold protein YncE